MTFEEKLHQKASEVAVGEYASLTDLANTIDAKILGEPVFKVDKRGNEALFMTLLMKNDKKVVQKYTKTAYKTLEEDLESCGGLTVLQNEWFTWTRQRVGRAQHERFYPQPNTPELKPKKTK